MAGRSPVTRISKEMSDLLGDIKKKHKENFGISLSDREASCIIAHEFKRKQFLKEGIDNIGIFR